ncbi:LLM class flavin-dependent oxidoreductase [Actinomadura sp. 7K534]|uniref:LLM class flavin-dependent oxidoreductase n=1 Tax=Actinomadura sp. 7K534 TaxID=2530366 RepID=UPI0010457F8F|nr:LLM class flavin-dependent oxidoreductase [Actinomadura sp. 7K534]TDB95479.1 LLM class flavin-dependent oxidoreductase [Actinomadura sp. 7K534]
MTAPRLGICMPLTSTAPTAGGYLAQLTAEAEAADAAGLDLVMLPEHHQGVPVSYAAPLTLAAHLLARTSRITVATGVLVLPAHHPVHLAEQVTMLDNLSGGRFALGVGAGYQESDLAPFGVGLADRGAVLTETLTGLGALLSSEEAAFAGDHVAFPSFRLRPRPLSAPRPPIWLGSWSRTGVRRAAELADGWIADPIRTITEIAEMAAAYRAAGGTGPVVVMREAWVDTDVATARRAFEPAIAPVFGYYRKSGAYTGSFDDLAADRFVLGSADDCVAQARDVADRTGADIVLLTVRHPAGPGHPETLEHIAALGNAWKAVRI